MTKILMFLKVNFILEIYLCILGNYLKFPIKIFFKLWMVIIKWNVKNFNVFKSQLCSRKFIYMF